jgi:transposase
MEDVNRGALQSKRGRKLALDTLNQCINGLVVQPLFETIERLEENVKNIEKQLRDLTKDDKTVELLKSIPGCGEVCAWTIRAYIDDINRFASPKKLVSFAGLAPWVQNSNETVHHGKITKRGPKELRTALVQVVMGMRRMKAKTLMWRLMQRHEAMKKTKIPGKAIIATARKVTVFIWHMLSKEAAFDVEKMVDKKLEKKSEVMSQEAKVENAVLNENEWEEKQAATRIVNKSVKKPALPGKKRKVG